MTKSINTPQELIPITAQAINGIDTLTCNGRALHAFLEVGRDYSTWMKERIEKYGFEENQDYMALTKNLVSGGLLPKFGEQKGRGGYNRIEYILSIDMAKQVAMVENNDKGLVVRRYFIECEHIAKEAVHCKIGSYSAHISETIASENQIPIQTFNGQAFTSSLDVAEYFHKRHSRIVSAIQNLTIVPDFWQRNFVQFYGPNHQPAYNMTKEGFLFVTANFSGPYDLNKKIRYIEAYNRMDANGPQQPLQLPVQPRLRPQIPPYEDVVREFICECAETGAKHFERLTSLYDAYRQWCRDNEQRIVSKIMLGRALKRLGYKTFRHNQNGNNGNTCHQGIRLVKSGTSLPPPETLISSDGVPQYLVDSLDELLTFIKK